MASIPPVTTTAIVPSLVSSSPAPSEDVSPQAAEIPTNSPERPPAESVQQAIDTQGAVAQANFQAEQALQTEADTLAEPSVTTVNTESSTTPSVSSNDTTQAVQVTTSNAALADLDPITLQQATSQGLDAAAVAEALNPTSQVAATQMVTTAFENTSHSGPVELTAELSAVLTPAQVNASFGSNDPSFNPEPTLQNGLLLGQQLTAQIAAATGQPLSDADVRVYSAADARIILSGGTITEANHTPIDETAGTAVVLDSNSHAANVINVMVGANAANDLLPGTQVILINNSLVGGTASAVDLNRAAEGLNLITSGRNAGVLKGSVMANASFGPGNLTPQQLAAFTGQPNRPFDANGETERGMLLNTLRENGLTSAVAWMDATQAAANAGIKTFQANGNPTFVPDPNNPGRRYPLDVSNTLNVLTVGSSQVIAVAGERYIMENGQMIFYSRVGAEMERNSTTPDVTRPGITFGSSFATPFALAEVLAAEQAGAAMLAAR